jgi:AcrR family transcriptional regulator
MSHRTASGDGGRPHTRSSDDLASKRRSEILQAAIRVISHRGADHARLVDIADEAGVSVGLIQHYFRTRSALLSDVFGSAMDNSLKTFQAYAADDRSASEDVVQLCRILTREPFDEIFSLWLEFFSLSNRDRTFRARSGASSPRSLPPTTWRTDWCRSPMAWASGCSCAIHACRRSGCTTC